MTVLRRDDVRGFESKHKRNLMVGLAMIVVGLAAAFGISQLISNDAGVNAESPAHAQAAERGAAMQANIDTLTRNGLAQQQALQAQVNAVQAREAFEKAIGAQAATAWTLEDELAAIHGRTGTEPTSTVGSTVSQPTPEQTLAGIQGRTGYQSAVTTTAQPTVEQELAAIEARTGVEQAKPAPEPTSGPR